MNERNNVHIIIRITTFTFIVHNYSGYSGYLYTTHCTISIATILQLNTTRYVHICLGDVNTVIRDLHKINTRHTHRHTDTHRDTDTQVRMINCLGT